MKAQFINLFWSVCKKRRGCQARCRRRSRGWAGQACCLHHGSTAPLPTGTETCCPRTPLRRGQGRGRLQARAAGIPSLPQTCLPGRQPQAAREAARNSLARQRQPGAARVGAGEGAGCPGRVKAFQAKIPQQKAGSASELKSKC